MKRISRTIYFTDHPKILKRLEEFSKKQGVTLSNTVLGFCALGLTVLLSIEREAKK